jgi:tetratricopeptide (TPR) repeat protein
MARTKGTEGADMIARLALGTVALCLGAAVVVADQLSDCSRGRSAASRLSACTAVIEGDAYSPDEKALAYRTRGNARADAGAGVQAVADFTQAITLRPDDASGYAGRARARLGLRDLDGAIADYGEALRLAPGSSAHHTGRGHAHYVKGDTKAAIADFDEALRINPDSPSTLNRRGLAYRRAGDLERAIEDYTAALALNPIYALAYNNRGYAREAQGRKDAAIADFQAAVLLDPSLIGAKEGLKRLGAPAVWFTESERRVAAGKALVEKNCAGCHAVGAQGASPNAKAPEFRNLSARHPSLALREPLSRGIAAPHDEMPKFALSGPEIDTIVAYINSLGVGADWATTVKRASEAARRPRPIADGQDLGDADRGLAYARKACAACHNVLRTERPSPNRQAPPFTRIAATPGMSVTALTVWSRTTHPTMPNLVIAPDDMDDLIAYILSLRERR